MRSMRTRVVAVVLLAALAVQSFADRVDDLVRAEMKKSGIPGLSLAVVQKGKVVKKAGYGFASLELEAKATPQTVYEIGSVTKQFTAMLTLMLVDEGKVKLDESVRTYLPDTPEAWQGVTVRHLLTHTSGIKSYTSVSGLAVLSNRQLETSDVVAMVKDLPMDFQPGERFLYNNTGYYLLGAIVEKVTGETYWDLLRQRVFEPLGMASSRSSEPGAVIRHRARGYLGTAARHTNANPISSGAGWAAGSILSSIEDMIKWDASLRARKFLKPETYTLMWTADRLNSGASAGYGFGWMIESVNGRKLVHHGGNTLSQSAMIERYLDDDLTVIVLSNLSRAPVPSLTRKIARMYAPNLIEKPISDDKPELTAKAKAFIEGLSRGQLDENAFTPSMRENNIVTLVRQQLPAMRQWGALQRIELLERRGEPANPTSRYRVVFANDEVQMIIGFSAEGLIAGLQIRPG